MRNSGYSKQKLITEYSMNTTENERNQGDSPDFSLDLDDSYPEILIERFLSGGVTVIVPSEIRYGRAFRRMMGRSIGTGEPLFGRFRTRKRPILFYEHGEADRKDAARRGLTGEGIEVRDNNDSLQRCPRMPSCIGEIERSRCDVIFLPDYEYLDGNYAEYMRKYEGIAESDLRSSESYRRKKGRMEIDQLRNCAEKSKKYLILTAGTLTGKRNLRDFPWLDGADCLIKIYDHTKNDKRDKGIVRIEVRGGNYTGSGEFDMVYDEDPGILRLVRKELARYGDLPLIANDREILDALNFLGRIFNDGEPILSEAEIIRATRLPRSTVCQRLEYLSRQRKGKLVTKLPDGRWKAL